MDAAILKAVNSITEDIKVSTGIHHVDFIISIIDNKTNEEKIQHFAGTVSKLADQKIKATATIPWINVVGRLAISMGATQQNILNKIEEAILGAVNNDTSIGDAILEMDVRVAGMVDKICKQIVEKLPKVPRSGATKVAVTEQIDIETMTMEDSDVVTTA